MLLTTPPSRQHSSLRTPDVFLAVKKFSIWKKTRTIFFLKLYELEAIFVYFYGETYFWEDQVFVSLATVKEQKKKLKKIWQGTDEDTKGGR